MVNEDLLKRIRDRLEDTYRDRLQGVLLYGSSVRNEAGPESDIDLLVLLQGPVSFGQELETIIEALYPLQLEVLRPIHARPVDVRVFEAGEFAFYRNVKREGIRL